MKLFLKVVLSIFYLNSYAQDPSCEYVVIMKNIDLDLYSYTFFTQEDYTKEPIDSVLTKLKKDWFFSGQHRESAVIESKKEEKILISYKDDYCYPNPDLKYQLRIIVAREHIDTKKMELMYANTEMIPWKTEIIINGFLEGERKCEVYNYKQKYDDDKDINYEGKAFREFRTRLIFIN